MKSISQRSRLMLAGAVAVLGIGTILVVQLGGDGGNTAAAPEADSPDAKLSFSDQTLAFGVLVDHRQGDDHLTGLDESLGSGACALDYDDDGWMDLFIVNGSGDTRYYGRRHWWQRSTGHSLLRNRDGNRFEDVSAHALSIHPTQGMACVAADFDNDGHTDLFVTGFNENLMLRNLGNGKFMDVTEKAGVKGFGWQTAAAVADVDGDGLLDLYVGRFLKYQKGARAYEPGSQYKQDVSGAFNSALYPAETNSLYRNRGGFAFEDVAVSAGVDNPDGRTLGAQWIDVDDDERPDLIVANAAGTGSTVVYRNNGKWKFRSLGTEARLQAASGARAAALGDLNNDGVPEVLLTATNGAQSAIFFKGGEMSASRTAYFDRARQWGFARDEYSGFSPWSAVTSDFDNDGLLDVFVVNGLAIPDPDVPRLTVGQPKQLWLNTGDSLQPVALASSDPLLDRQSARGIVTADFDNDGDVDLYVTHNNDLGQLLINGSNFKRHWVGLKLLDTEGNREAVGSRVAVTTSENAQYRWTVTSAGFMSGSDPRVHFGLGKATSVKRIVVTWPDGGTTTYRNVPADTYVLLERGEDAVPIDRPPVPSPGNYSSLARGSEPALRADYMRLLVAARGLAASSEEIKQAVSDPDPVVRKALVEILDAQQNTQSLAALLNLLADSDPEIVQAALQSVCRYEEEDAMRWLLRLVQHPSPAVRTKLADCLAFYFHEEEAVLHRKYLAIPYLVEMLEDKEESVQLAAAKALGNAERFRGVAPLIELARRTQSVTVRAEAVRDVGLIRDKAATRDLVAMLADPNIQKEPAAVAQLLVALKRLDYTALPAVLGDFGAGRKQFSSMPVATRLAAMQVLLTSEDGIVLPRDQVAALARQSYGASASSVNASEATVVALLDVLRTSRDTASIPLLNTIASSGKTPAVRGCALEALVSVDPARAPVYVERGLDAEPQVGAKLLERIAGQRVDISDRALGIALARADTRANVLAVVRRVRSRPHADTIFQIVQDRTASADLRAAAIEALSRAPFPYTLPHALFNETHEKLAVAVVHYEMSRLPPLVVSRTAPPMVDKLLAMPAANAVRLATVDELAARKEFWAKGAILTLLKDSKDTAIRTHIMSLLTSDALEGSGILETIANDRSDPMRIDALRHLEGREGTSAEQLLVSVLRDGKEDPHARVVAAHRLVSRLGPDVLKILEKS